MGRRTYEQRVNIKEQEILGGSSERNSKKVIFEKNMIRNRRVYTLTRLITLF